MSSIMPNGSAFSISTAYGSAKTVTSVSNANPGVATATAHGLTDGDIVLPSMVSVRLDNRPFRLSGSATNAFNLEGINTTSTTLYPSGFGAGSVKKVTTWQLLQQTVDIQYQGGDQNYNQWIYAEDGQQRQRPTFKNAKKLRFTYDYDPSQPWHSALKDANDDSTVRVLRVALPDGSYLYFGGTVSFDGQPSMTINENMKVVLEFAFANPEVTRYAS